MNKVFCLIHYPSLDVLEVVHTLAQGSLSDELSA
jgi:hypothetical protein